MTTLVNLTRAEFRKIATSLGYLIALGVSVGLAVISVVIDAAVAGQPGQPVLGTTAGVDQMLKFGSVSCVAMLVIGIIAAGGEYRHNTIVPTALIAPRRGLLVLAKAIAIAVAGIVLNGVTFGSGLVTIAVELSSHHLHRLPPEAWHLYWGAVVAGTLLGLIGTGLGYITKSTVVAVVAAVGWVIFGELVILQTAAPQLVRWLIAGSASALTDPTAHGLAAGTATAVLSAYTLAALVVAWGLVRRRDIA
jgi:hypothetical protein